MKKYDKVHFLGIGGISQSALALILKSQGVGVSGSDIVESETVTRLRKNGIDITINGVSGALYGSDLVVKTASIPDNDKELLLAKKLNKTIITRAELLGEIAKTYRKVISISGTHGKTTTTGMIAKIFCDAGKNPTVHIGGEFDFMNGNLRVGGQDYFITEACEYVDSFLCLKSDISVILNIQKDHLDYFKNFSNIKKSFKKFAQNTKLGGIVVYNGDDIGLLGVRANNIAYSISNKGILTAKNIIEYVPGKYSYDCYFLGTLLGRVYLGVYGEHNISNSLSAICVGLNEGIAFDSMARSLFDYCGAKRRFESYGELFGTLLVHDYAHHPAEIVATIRLAKHIAKGDLYVVFQPHTFSRTKLLLKDFKTCFKGAKEVFVYKTYGARETAEQGLGHIGLTKELKNSGVCATAFNNYLSMLKFIFPKLKSGDILLVLGAGDIVNFLSYVKGCYKRFDG